MDRRLLLLLPLLMLLPAGCGGQGAGPAPHEAASGGAEEVKAAYRKSPEQCLEGKEHWRAAGAPKRGGSLVRSGGELPTLDITRPAPRGGDPGPHVYQTLFTTRGCWYGDTTMVPLLAQSWQIAPDGVTVTVKLRDGVKWHNLPPVNGRAFTSADVGFSIGHHNDARHQSAARAFWQGVTHQQPDASTVVMKLPEPDADFIQKLGQFRNAILPREVRDQDGDYTRTAVGTGPFVFQPSSWKPDIGHTVTRNPAYYEMGADGNPLPYLDEVRNIRFAEYTAEVAAFRSGQLDRTGTFGLLKAEADEYRRIKPNEPRREELQLSAYGVWINTRKPPWNDVRVRRAISLAIDRDDLVASNRGGAVLGGFVPSTMLEYSWSEEKKREKFRSDRERAKALLAEAGIPAGFSTVLITGGQYQEDAEVVQHHLTAVGINATLEIEGRSWGPIYNGDKVTDLGWGGYPGGAMLNDLIKGAVESGNPQNRLGFSDPDVDRLARAQAGEYDETKRIRFVDQLQERLHDQMPYIPVITRVYYHFYSCRTQNVPWTKNTDGHMGLRYYWIDQSGC